MKNKMMTGAALALGLLAMGAAPAMADGMQSGTSVTGDFNGDGAQDSARVVVEGGSSRVVISISGVGEIRSAILSSPSSTRQVSLTRNTIPGRPSELWLQFGTSGTLGSSSASVEVAGSMAVIAAYGVVLDEEFEDGDCEIDYRAGVAVLGTQFLQNVPRGAADIRTWDVAAAERICR